MSALIPYYSDGRSAPAVHLELHDTSPVTLSHRTAVGPPRCQRLPCEAESLLNEAPILSPRSVNRCPRCRILKQKVMFQLFFRANEEVLT